MSSYCPYDVTSSSYDSARSPLDVDDLQARLEALALRRKVRVEDLKILDVGAGTGIYCFELRRRGCLVQYTGVEGSQGMINQFQAKMKALDAGARGVFSLTHGTVPPLSFPEQHFDAVITTQVLHHMTDATHEDKFAPVWRLLADIHRVLSPGGFLWCQTQSPEQHIDGFWWTPIIPQAQAELASRFAPMDTFIGVLKQDQGFATVDTHVPNDTLMQLDLYKNVHGPFDEKFRNCDSGWSLAGADELKEGLKRLQSVVDGSDGGLAWMEERELKRVAVGQTTTVVATK